jgi:CelD/BcsL family acetyltransferase involved in cellulose biosynthesis
MATIEVGSSAAVSGATDFRRRRALWRGPRFIAEVFDGADEALAALEAVQGGLISLGFQTLDWLTILYEELAPSRGAMPRVVVVTERNSGEVALVLPLVVEKARGIRIARFADFGVADYAAPILGLAPLTKRRSIRRVWRAVRRALRDVDLINFERMPARIGGRPNPLATRWGIVPAQHAGHLIVIPDTVDAYARSLGKKFRKELERCYRVWEKEGSPRFYRATDPEKIAHVYTVLEEQQAARQGLLGNEYVLDSPAYRAFYERLAIDGSDAELAATFALESRGEIVATLFGIMHDGTFTLLRIAIAGEEWKHLSAGRLAVIEAMKYFVSRGIRHFDMGIGDYRFKRGLGAMSVPLYDLVAARSIAGLPAAAYHHCRGRLRRNRYARAIVQRVKSISAH